MFSFLESLITTGFATFGTIPQEKPRLWLPQRFAQVSPEADALLRKCHFQQQLHLPGDSLAYHPAAAHWGLQQIYILSAALAFRELDLPQVESWLTKDMPDPLQPEAHLSADICLSFLPDLSAIASRISDGDPLISLLSHYAVHQPLSSVGMELPSTPDLSVISTHPGLSQLHAERVVQRSDTTRAETPAVAIHLKAFFGDHASSLSPHPSLITS